MSCVTNGLVNLKKGKQKNNPLEINDVQSQCEFDKIISFLMNGFCFSFNYTGSIHGMFDESSAYIRTCILGAEISYALGRFPLEFSISIFA